MQTELLLAQPASESSTTYSWCLFPHVALHKYEFFLLKRAQYWIFFFFRLITLVWQIQVNRLRTELVFSKSHKRKYAQKQSKNDSLVFMMRRPNLDVADCSTHHLRKQGKVKENYNQNTIPKFEMALNWAWFF